ncbi:galactan 5-O-arabinofuranosyltransferase [Rhodococcus sp. W8901]|uniref:galactan 5-O-arabinofuranosyltransferase n=1 Tax=Rhodococcus sp. W8901 TaxID=2742603 RepID=UPI001583B770|nr:galactan 5-O-arabinofuranosyltransferase [Rhodococcus sp. W8901]QKT13876.1 galactan 5-O-arabinofuranosyltransferase [Rhodococcus sp. W8901]
MLLAAVVAAIVAAVGLFAFGQVSWPAFPSSNVTQAVTTVGQIVTIAVLAVSVLLYRARRWVRAATVLSWAGLSGFVTVTLGMPLSATKLYLHGVSVDQEFRTEYLTRLTDSAALHDMTYADLPPYYPAGWFWIGGRVANLLGMDGWEAFKPYAIASIAVAAVLALVLWNKLIRADWAVVVALAAAALTVAYGSAEPYGAVIAVLIPPVLVLAWGGLYRPEKSTQTRSGGWGAVVGTGLFLGVAAAFYTLYLGFAAFAVTLMAIVSAGLAVRAQGSWRAMLDPLLRLIVTAAIAIAIALTVWLPYLLEALRGIPADSGTATHYLPDAGAHLPLPMLHFSLAGALCMLGTIWLVSRAASSRRAQALGIGVIAVYLWSLLSMTATVVGSTLLSFRLEPVLILLLGTAGVFGFFEFSRWLVLATSENPRVKASIVVIGLAGLIAFTQNIPQVLASDITIAYTDTDGDGVRADKRPPGAAAYYGDVDRIITEQRPGERHDTVVLTSDTSFLSFYPYFGFQALTSHYANPLAEFRERAAAIESWTELETPDQLIAALDELPWRAPDVFVFRKGSDGYTLRLAEDVYPNDPNVRRYSVTFPKELFDDPRFTIEEAGPFVVVNRVG